MRSKFTPGEKAVNLIGKPQPKQVEFLEATQRYVAFGGARGGGKSWALRRKSLILAMGLPGIRIIILRRTLKDLRGNHIRPMLAEVGDIVYFNSDERTMYFPNKSYIEFGYLDSESDMQQYQGQEYDIICMDEATQFTEEQFRELGACLRGGNPKYPKRFYLTCNPGGVGHAWVKRLFIDREFKDGENQRDYFSIRSYYQDNAYNGDGYEQMLDSLPEKVKDAWKYGNWDSFTGQYFTEWDPQLHVTQPFAIPEGWRRYYVNDYGLDMLAGYWIAVDYNENAYVYKEIYQSNLPVSDAAYEIKKLEGSDQPDIRLAPPDLWSRTKDSGKSVIELFSDNGLYFARAANDRIAGWMALHEWLKPFSNDKREKTARLKIFSNCANLIRTIPLMQFDSKNTNDAAKDPHEITHAPDALRYWAVMRPFSNPQPQKEPRFGFEDMQKEYQRRKNPYGDIGIGAEFDADDFLKGW